MVISVMHRKVRRQTGPSLGMWVPLAPEGEKKAKPAFGYGGGPVPLGNSTPRAIKPPLTRPFLPRALPAAPSVNTAHVPPRSRSPAYPVFSCSHVPVRERSRLPYVPRVPRVPRVLRVPVFLFPGFQSSPCSPCSRSPEFQSSPSSRALAFPSSPCSSCSCVPVLQRSRVPV